MKKHNYLILVLIFIFQQGFCQNKKFLIIESDTLRLIITEQVDSISDFVHQSPIGIEESGNNQTIYWKIRRDSLFQIKSENEKFYNSYMDSWNGILYCPDGELLHDFGLTQVYTQEKGFVIRNGIVVDTSSYDNTSTIFSPYSNYDKEFYDYLKNVIDIKKLDYENCTKKIYIHIKRLNKDNMIQEVEILRGCDEQTNIELSRAMKTIPQWSVIYLHGQKTDYYTTIYIELDKLKSTTR